ncbi:MAG: porin family protein [Candidatus Paracaedibacteraceae bacterium]|nr:porin family protein [Candidatus Paracaedibacteraceae bacterium]
MKKILLLSSMIGLISGAEATRGNIYVGPFVGMGITDGKFTSVNDANNIRRNNRISDKGFLGGLLVGYAHPCNNLLMGFELLGNFDTTDDKILEEKALNNNETFKIRNRASYGFSARIGYRTSSDAVAFIRLGGEWTTHKFTYRGTDQTTILPVSKSTTKFAFVPGIGIEAPVGGKWRARLEAKYSLPKKMSFRIPNTVPAALTFENSRARIRTGQTSVVMGVTYSFG